MSLVNPKWEDGGSLQKIIKEFIERKMWLNSSQPLSLFSKCCVSKKENLTSEVAGLETPAGELEDPTFPPPDTSISMDALRRTPTSPGTSKVPCKLDLY